MNSVDIYTVDYMIMNPDIRSVGGSVFPGVMLVSNKNIYILSISGHETEEPSDWLHSVSSAEVTKVRLSDELSLFFLETIKFYWSHDFYMCFHTLIVLVIKMIELIIWKRKIHCFLSWYSVISNNQSLDMLMIDNNSTINSSKLLMILSFRFF